MNQLKVSKLVRSECDLLLRQGVLSPEIRDEICSLYPVSRWDWRSLGRWFLFFGAISTVAGASILAHEYVEFTLRRFAVLLAVVLVCLFAGAHHLKLKGFSLTGRALELMAALDIIGLTFTLGIIYSTGSGNWPALLLIDLLIILPLSYLLHNVLILVLSAVVFFTWFGGVTGYVSGWGAYFFGMNYPLRFFAISIFMVAAAVLHLQSEKGPLAPYRGFFKVWLSSGLFFGEMSLWLLSIFGNYETINGPWHERSTGELFLFNAVWACLNVLFIYMGSRYAVRMVVAYGVTFLIIQGYTLYFDHIASALPAFMSFGIAGIAGLVLAWTLERRISGRGSKSGIKYVPGALK